MSAGARLFKAAAPVFAVLLVVIFGVAGVAVADIGTSGGLTYTMSTSALDVGGWQVTVGQLSGGNDSVTTVFNDASRASGTTMVLAQ